MLVVASHVVWVEALQPGKKSICDPALRWDLQVAQDKDEWDVDLDVARWLFRPAQRGAPQDPPGRGDRRPTEVTLHRHPPPGAAPGWKQPSQRLAEEIVREYVNQGGLARTHVPKVLERDHEAPGELRVAAALRDEWTRDLVSSAQEHALPVGVGCRLRDAIRGANKVENDSDIRREERDQRTEVGKQQGNANLPKEVFLVLGKHTRAAALNAALEACFGTGFDPVNSAARGRISLRCSRKVADALRKGIVVGGWSVHVESEEPTDDDELPHCPKGAATKARGSAERGCEGKGKGKRYGRGIRCYGCASTHPWSQCRLVKYESLKEHCGKCGERGHLQDLCEATRASREWYVAEYNRPWEWTAKLLLNVEGERHRSREHSRQKRGRRSRSRSRSPRSGRSSNNPRRDSWGRRRSRDGGRGRGCDGNVAWERRREHGYRDRDCDREDDRDRHREWDQDRDLGRRTEAGSPLALPWHWVWSPQPAVPSPDAGHRVPSPWDGHPSGAARARSQCPRHQEAGPH